MRRLAFVLAAALFSLSACKRSGDELTSEEQLRRARIAAKAAIERPAPDLAAAQRAYQQIVNLKPDDADALMKLARIEARRGRDAEATMTLARLAEVAPTNPEPHRLRGDILLHSGLADGAVKEFRAALVLAPDDLESRRQLARALLKKGNIAEARKEVDTAWAAHPEDAATEALLAEIKLEQNDEAGARLALESAVAAAPNDPSVRIARARYLRKQGRFADAAADLKVAWDADPTDREVALLYADTLTRAGDHGEASAVASQLARSLPDDADARLALVDMRLAAGDDDGAAQAAEEAYNLGAKHDPRVFYALGRGAELKGDKDGALEQYQHAVAEDPGFVRAQKRLGEIYAAAGRTMDAISAYEVAWDAKDLSADDKLALASLYAKTGLHAERGLELVKAVLAERHGDAQAAAVQKALEKSARTEPRRAKRSSEPEVVKWK